MRKLCALAIGIMLCSAAAHAAGPTAAGTVIANTASADYSIKGIPQSPISSTASVTVAQLTDDTVTWQNAGTLAVNAGATDQALLYKLTNTGNGDDTFTLAAIATPASGVGFLPANCRVYFDTDNDGVFSGPDTQYVPGTNDPLLAAGTSVSLLVVCDVPASAPDTAKAEIRLTATSKTASGAPGAVETGGGVGGVDAVVGLSGADASANGTYQASNVAYGFVATQAVTDPAGGSAPVSGATILYTLTVTPKGSATGTNLVVTDPIPANTTYVPGSLTLDGAPLGDSAADGDAGDYNVTTPGAISVRLGTLAGSGAAQSITFKVTIN